MRYAGLGFEIVVPVLLGVGAGWWLDSKFGTEPWLLLVGALVGIGAGMLNFLRAVSALKPGQKS